MTVFNKTGNSTWTKINSIFNKTGSSTWREIVSAWVKTASSTWTQVFIKVAVPANTVLPDVTGSTYLYGTLTGTLGTWTAPNGTNSYARQWQSAANNNGSPGSFSNITGATSSTYDTTLAENGRFVRLRVTATNLSGSSTAFSYEQLITKYAPVALTIPVISGSATVDNTLTALTTVGTYWKNTTTNSGDTAPDSFTYRWYWGDTGDNIGTNSSTYTVQPSDIGHTIRVEVTAKNTGGEASSTSNATGVVGAALGISQVSFTDYFGRTAFNNRGSLTTATSTRLSWVVTNVTTSTTFRVRYRVLNNQTGAYWNPATVTAASDPTAAWLSYSGTYSGSGNISSIVINGTTANIYDIFTLSDTFNGSTFGGGINRWTLEYEISVYDGNTRYYWVPGNATSQTPTYDWWYIDPASQTTLNASATTVSPGTTVTFSGNITSYPGGFNSYPYAYRVTYGDGTDSGWQTVSYGTSNPSFSFNKSYSSAGTYVASVDITPYYSSSTKTITVANNLTAPTIYSVSATQEGAAVTAYFSGGSGPYYQIYWTTGTAPTNPVTPDGSGSSSPITDSTGPSAAAYTWYMYVRSVASLGETSVGPSTLASAWSSGYAFTVTAAPVIPTISMAANTNVTANSGTINWTSTNQASYSSNGTFSGTGTNGTSISKSGLSSNTTYTGTVTVTSSTGHTASANYSLTTLTAFNPPSSGTPSWSSSNFSRKTTSPTHLQWFTDYPSISGDGTFTGMQFEIRTTAGGGTLLASGTRAFPGFGSYPYSAGGTIWAFRMGTTDGDISYSSSARYGRVRTVMQGTNGVTYYGPWTGWI